MDDTIHLSSMYVTIAGSFAGILLAVIAFFLSRLIRQFDQLNATMMKIDKDLSGEVGTLKVQHENMNRRMTDVEPLFDRVRTAENKIAVIESGCQIKRKDLCQ